MTSPPAPATLFDEPWSVLLVVSGLLVLPAGTGLQVFWLIMVGLGAALLRQRERAGGAAAASGADRDGG